MKVQMEERGLSALRSDYIAEELTDLRYVDGEETCRQGMERTKVQWLEKPGQVD